MDLAADGTNPSAPTDLVASAGASGITLNWNGTAATDYTVSRSTVSGGPYTQVGIVPTGTTTNLTLNSPNSAIAVGQPVAGPNIQTSPITTVASISGTALTLSQPTLGSASTLTFFSSGTVNNSAQWLVANPNFYSSSASSWWGYGALNLGTGTITISGKVVGPQGATLIPGSLGGIINSSPCSSNAGNTLFVDSINGNDSTGALGSPQFPYKTIGAAITAASSGQLVFAKTGTYTEIVTGKNGVTLNLAPGAVLTDAPSNGATPGLVNLPNGVNFTISGSGSIIEIGNLGNGSAFYTEGTGTLTVSCSQISSSSHAFIGGNDNLQVSIMCSGPSVGVIDQGAGNLYYQAQSIYGEIFIRSFSGTDTTPGSQTIVCPNITVPAGDYGCVSNIGGNFTQTIYGNLNCAYDGIHVTPIESTSPSGLVGTSTVYGNITAGTGAPVYCEAGTVTVYGNVCTAWTGWTIIGGGDAIFDLNGTVKVYGNARSICPVVLGGSGNIYVSGSSTANVSSSSNYFPPFVVATDTTATTDATTNITLATANPSIAVGQPVAGPNIQTSPITTVASISGTALTLSQPTLGSASTLTFFSSGTVNNSAQWLVANPNFYSSSASSWWGYGALNLGTGTITINGGAMGPQGVSLDLGGGTINTSVCRSATANTLFVDSVNGSDTTGTPGNPQLPYKTISAAISAATAPALVSVRTGTYTEALNLVDGVNLCFAAGAVVTYAPTDGAQPGVIYSNAETSVIDGEGSFVETGTLGDGTVLNVNSGTLTVHCHAITAASTAQNAILVGGTAPVVTVVCDGSSLGCGEQGSGYLYFQAQSINANQFGYNSYGNSSMVATEIINCPSITTQASGGGDIFNIGGPCTQTIYGTINSAYDGVHVTPEESISPSGYAGTTTVYGNITAGTGCPVYCESGLVTVYGNVNTPWAGWTIIGGGDGVFDLDGNVNVYGNVQAPCPVVLAGSGAVNVYGNSTANSVSSVDYLPPFIVATAAAATTGSFTDSSVCPGMTYYYVVTASNAGQTSPTSNEASAMALTAFRQWLVAQGLYPTALATSTPYTLPATTSDGLTITYAVVSGPAAISNDTLTLTGVGTVVLMATQAGNGTGAPLSDTETITVTGWSSPAVTDTPTMPPWGLSILAFVLMGAAAHALPKRLTQSPRDNRLR